MMTDHVQKHVLNASQVAINVIVDADKYAAIDAHGACKGNNHGPVKIGLIIKLDGKIIHTHYQVGQDGELSISGGEQVLLTKGPHKLFVEFPNENADATAANAEIDLLQ
jgi:hypothetical protein